ncbi:AFG1-like ATPase-domain-containing protein [Rhexocercosporidium sp. MPI-PUGE-AT-0058]|nr:AFG1-like ATPase-domain-containing protein [Rhexocercosporidium sp. MPI-PUGE-AT-0058]
MSQIGLKSAYAALLKRQRLTPNPGQLALVNRLANLQTSLLQLTKSKSHVPLQGVYIYGDVGTGKSRVADLFASTLHPSITHRRIHFYEFMMDIHTRLHHARSSPTYTGDPLLQIGRDVRAQSQVLCFDEFQVTDIADALILKRLFNSIWESGGVMVSTSNRLPENLYENGLNRDLFLPFIGELRRNCEVWRMEGKEDYRISTGGGKDRVDVFFTDAREFEGSLRGRVGPVELERRVIPVLMSRQLMVMAAESRDEKGLVVSSTFEDLCQNFLGSADYYALCKTANVIYLTGLRKFASDELDFVRRFITLVDLAYETKTRIVCLSSVPLFEVFSNIVPKKLHVEGQLKEALGKQMTVKGEGGSSSSMMSTFIGEMEWSATGLAEASLATGGAGDTDVGFAVGRAISRLYEMGSQHYGVSD